MYDMLYGVCVPAPAAAFMIMWQPPNGVVDVRVRGDRNAKRNKMGKIAPRARSHQCFYPDLKKTIYPTVVTE